MAGAVAVGAAMALCWGTRTDVRVQVAELAVCESAAQRALRCVLRFDFSKVSAPKADILEGYLGSRPFFFGR